MTERRDRLPFALIIGGLLLIIAVVIVDYIAEAADGPVFGEPALVSASPARGTMLQVGPLPTPPDPVVIVNSLPYRLYHDQPAMMAYRIVAAVRGWDHDRIEAWAPFVRDVMIGESGFCWNRRRGDAVAFPDDGPVGCHIVRQGTHEDVGFGQVTTSFYGSNALLCTEYGICSRAQILASPWTSMLWSVVVPIELAGSQPWCFNARARDYHDCWLAPDR